MLPSEHPRQKRDRRVDQCSAVMDLPVALAVDTVMVAPLPDPPVVVA